MDKKPKISKNPAHRPEKPIEWSKVDMLLMAGCTGTEIAANFDIYPDTLYNRVKDKYGMTFTAYSAEKKQKGDSLLRVKQFEKALEKDNSMLIWLGKQRLEQREPDDKSKDFKELADNLQKMGDFFEKLRAMQSSENKAPEEDHTE